MPKQVTVYQLHKIIPYTLRVRRPTGPGANPKVGPGGTDYRSDPLPSARFDCEPPSWLFREMKLADIRACVKSLNKTTLVPYRVKWLPAPYLEVQADDDTPECLKSSMPVIPVPREIFFQSNEEGRLDCFSSRLKIEGNEIAGFKMPIDKLNVRLDFPVLQPPSTDEETVALLMTWAMAPFWDHATFSLEAHLVTDKICAACLGEKTKLGPTDPEPLLWPE